MLGLSHKQLLGVAIVAFVTVAVARRVPFTAAYL